MCLVVFFVAFSKKFVSLSGGGEGRVVGWSASRYLLSVSCRGGESYKYVIPFSLK